MDYCAPIGIPHSVFLSWGLADQEKALAWQAFESRRCGQCGTHLDDWKESFGGDRFAWHAEPYSCPGCAELERHRERPDNPDHGFHMRLARGPASDCPHCRGR